MRGPIAETDGLEVFRGVVHPWHCDSMGHMSVQHQIPLLDDAQYHLLGELGPVTTIDAGRRLGWADVRHEIEYLHELVAGDLVVLRAGFLSVGRSSLRHRTVMARRSDGKVCTVMEGVTVRFDLDARAAVPLSDDQRALAAKLMLPPSPQPTII